MRQAALVVLGLATLVVSSPLVPVDTKAWEGGGAAPQVVATTPVLSKPKAPTRAERDRAYTNRVRLAPVDGRYASALSAYTGGSYSVGTVNSLWPRFPRSRQARQRLDIIDAAKRYHIPVRLLMGVYGMESGFGRFRCYFGLTGYFPGSGTSGSFRRDAFLSAGIFRRLLGRDMVR